LTRQIIYFIPNGANKSVKQWALARIIHEKFTAPVDCAS